MTGTTFAQANQLFKQGKVEEAIALYKKATTESNRFYCSHHNLGDALIKVGRIEEAAAAFRNALAINPKSTWSLYKLGKMLHILGQHEEAVGYLRQALEKITNVPEFYLTLGSCLVKLGQWSEAEECLYKVVELSVESLPLNEEAKKILGTSIITFSVSEAYFYLGEIKSGQQQWSEAVEFYRQCWETNPGKWECCMGWAASLGKLGRWSEAVECYRQRVFLFDQCGEFLFGFGQALAQLQQWDEAIVEYRKAINLGFAGAEVRHHLGYALGQLGKWDEAIVEYRLVVEMNPKSAQVRHQLGYGLMQLGRWGEAEIELRKAVELYPGSAVVWQQLGDVLRELGDSILDVQQERTPPEVFARTSIAYRKVMDYAEAEAVIIMGRKKNPNSVWLATEYAEIAMAKRDWGEAIKRWKDVLDKYEQRVPAAAYVRLSIVYRYIGDYASAESAVLRGREKHPNVVELATEYAEIAMIQCQWKEAICRWETAMNMHEKTKNNDFCLPKSSKIQDWFEGHWQATALYLQSGLVENDKFPSANLCVKIAEVLVFTEYVAAANSFVQLAIQKYPADLAIAVCYARIAMKQKDWLTAINRWHSAIDMHSRDIPACAYSSLNLCYYLMNDEEETSNAISHRLAQHSFLANLILDYAENDKIISSFQGKGLGKNLTQIYLIRFCSESSLSEQIESGVYITKNNINQLVEDAIGDKMGSIENRWINRFTSKVAKHFAFRFSRIFQSKYLPQEVLADAVFLQLLTELRILIPLRHLARKMARQNKESPVFIELPSRNINTLQSFYSELEPLFLYYELRRQGVNAFLCMEETSKYEELPEFQLHFNPTPLWSRKKLSNRNRKAIKSGLAILPDGIRGAELIIPKYEDARVFTAIFLSPAHPYTNTTRFQQINFTDSLYTTDLSPKSTDVSFDKVRIFKNKSANAITGEILISENLNYNLIYWLNYAICDLLDALAKRAIEFVRNNQITQLFICDHIFMESSIMAYAVKCYGGKITLWPHSINPVHFNIRRADNVYDQIYCVTKSGKNVLREKLPGRDIETKSNIMFLPPSKLTTSIHNKDQKLSVVIVGGGAVVGRMPVIPLKKHCASYRNLYSGLLKLKTNVNIFFKARGIHLDSFSWFQRVVGDSVNWRPAFAHVLQMDYPNTILLSVSLGSTALLEGIGRGIPAMIVRDFDVEDYTNLNSNFVPTGPTDYILQEITNCMDYEYRKLLIDKQIAYYCKEIGMEE